MPRFMALRMAVPVVAAVISKVVPGSGRLAIASIVSREDLVNIFRYLQGTMSDKEIEPAPAAIAAAFDVTTAIVGHDPSVSSYVQDAKCP